ncbi:MAG: filamentous hemagglutinin N-terminal domain-containing protein [Cyanobacteria bacterium J06621_11]
MMFQRFFSSLVARFFSVVLVSLGTQSALTSPLVAQVIPDASLGSERSNVNRAQTQIDGRSADLVDGGATRGESLFHSFRELNVSNQQQLYFSPDSDISTIFTRVTGENASRILGTLGVLGDADLFLINPNGIFFGPNAQLALSGSFLASSADGIVFSDAFTFGTTTPTAPPDALLTIQPSALIFNRLPSAATIESQAALEVAVGERLQMVGGNVFVTGDAANQRANLIARDGLIELGGLSSSGQVEFSDDGRLRFPEDSDLADVVLSSARLAVNSMGSGGINVTADNLSLSESRIVAGYAEDQSATQDQAGSVVLDASGDFSSNASLISNSLPSSSSGTVGNISIDVGGELLLENTEIVSLLDGVGKNGNTDILVVGDATISGSVIRNNVGGTGIGDGGNVTVRARSLLLETPNPQRRQSLIATDTFGQGDAGQLLIEADALTVLGPGVSGSSGITATSEGGSAVGDAGNIIFNIRGPIIMTQRGKVSAALTRGAVGIAGDISINAESVRLDDVSFIQSRNNRAVGRPGNIDINLTGALTLTGNSFIDTAVSVTSTAIERTDGDESGRISINAESVKLSNQGYVRVSSFGEGDAGRIEVVADLIEVDDPYVFGEISSASGFFSRTRPGAEGRGGNIVLYTRDLRLNENAVVSTQTDNEFPGGDIQIMADRIELTNGGQLLASSSAAGEAGSIDIVASETIMISDGDENYALQVQDATERFGLGFIGDLRRILNRQGENGVAASGIFLQSLGEEADAGAAGSLTITEASDGNLSLILSDGAEINAETVRTTGGNLTFSDLDIVLLRGESSITAEADAAGQAGNGGNITFLMPDGIVLATPNENNDIVANAFEGDGGNISILSRSIIGLEARDSRSSRSDISASSEFGSDGQITVDTLDIRPDQGLFEQSLTLVDQSNAIDRRCLADSRQGRSSFVVTGTGGVPPNPRDVIRNESAGLIDFGRENSENNFEGGDIGSTDLENVDPGNADPETGDLRSAEEFGRAYLNLRRAPDDDDVRPNDDLAVVSDDSIVEAQGWRRDLNGNIALTARQINATTVNRSMHSSACY